MVAIDYYYLGVEEYKKGNYTNALKYLLISDRLESHFKTCERIFQCYMSISKIEEARKYIEKAYMLNQKNDKVALEYAKLLLKFDEKISAIELLKNIIQRNNSYHPARELLNSIV